MTQAYTAADMAADERTEPTRPPLNGYELLGSVRLLPDDVNGGFIVLVDRNLPLPDRYVTGWVKTLTDHEWNHGNYHADYGDALTDLASRAQPWSSR